MSLAFLGFALFFRSPLEHDPVKVFEIQVEMSKQQMDAHVITLRTAVVSSQVHANTLTDRHT